MTIGKVLKMKFERLNIKHFAELATNNGVFGSAQASLKNEGIKTTDYNQIASMPAFKQGWNLATITAKALPPLEEMQGLQSYFSYLINYLYQQGIPAWDANYTYYVGSIVAVVDSQTNKVKLYSSLTNDNTGNDPSTSGNNWGILFDPSNFVDTRSNQTISGTKNFTEVTHTKTPAITAVSGEAVTAEWFNSKMQVVSALPANPDLNVFYFIPE